MPSCVIRMADMNVAVELQMPIDHVCYPSLRSAVVLERIQGVRVNEANGGTVPSILAYEPIRCAWLRTAYARMWLRYIYPRDEDHHCHVLEAVERTLYSDMSA